MKNKQLMVVLVPLLLAGCGNNVRETLGIAKPPPDEFAVIARPPLAVPPDFALRPPQPGAQRPQEATPRNAAASTVFGMNSPTDAPVSNGTEALLAKAGATNLPANLRDELDRETIGIAMNDRSVVQRLMFWDATNPNEPIVNAGAEAARLKQNQADKKPLNQGEVPTITRKRPPLLQSLIR